MDDIANTMFQELHFAFAVCKGSAHRIPVPASAAVCCPDCGLLYCSRGCLLANAVGHQKACPFIAKDCEWVSAYCTKETGFAASMGEMMAPPRPFTRTAWLLLTVPCSFSALMARSILQRWDMMDTLPSESTEVIESVLRNCGRIGSLRSSYPSYLPETAYFAQEVLLRHGGLALAHVHDEPVALANIVCALQIRILQCDEVDPRTRIVVPILRRFVRDDEPILAPLCRALVHGLSRISDGFGPSQWEVLRDITLACPRICALEFFSLDDMAEVGRIAEAAAAAPALRPLVAAILAAGGVLLHENRLADIAEVLCKKDATATLEALPSLRKAVGAVEVMARIKTAWPAAPAAALTSDALFAACATFLSLAPLCCKFGEAVRLAKAFGSVMCGADPRRCNIAAPLLASVLLFVRTILRETPGVFDPRDDAEALNALLNRTLVRAAAEPDFPGAFYIVLADLMAISPCDSASAVALAKALASRQGGEALCHLVREELGRRAKTPFASIRLCGILDGAERACDACAATDAKLRFCEGCYGARYCSRECQAKGWAAHKLVCKPSIAKGARGPILWLPCVTPP